MYMQAIDWGFVIIFLLISLVIGLLVARRAGTSASEFFLSGRNMPWWLLGISMVATTFSSSTPNLVTNITREHGVAGNWLWWSFLLTGMLTVFVYAKLWRKSAVNTDIEFYELRYSGKPAAFLRGFRALYLGVLFNVIIMADVCLAAMKLGAVLFGFSPVISILIASLITMIYCTLGGLRGVLITDFLQFGLAMFGAVAAAVIALRLPQVGGLEGLISNEAVSSKLAFFPGFSDTDALITLLIIPIAVQWWSVWYPGAEPGGGGYIAQRMLAAKNENHAVAAAFLFNVAHYALRPWPWILVGLASMIVFPTLESLQNAFPNISPDTIGHDLAYPAMLTYLPSGLLGIVITSLLAAFMSTISTHLNWGASYIVNDFYKRFINPKAGDRELVLVGRISTVVLMVLACILSLQVQTSLQFFHIMLQVGAGTGLLFILRWFWWRINAFSELTAMAISFVVAVYLQFWAPEGMPMWAKLVAEVVITTAAWLTATFLSRPTDIHVLWNFIRRTHPGGPGWKKVIEQAEGLHDLLDEQNKKWPLPAGIICMLLGTFVVWGALISTGFWIYGKWGRAILLTLVTLLLTLILAKKWKSINLMGKK